MLHLYHITKIYIYCHRYKPLKNKSLYIVNKILYIYISSKIKYNIITKYQCGFQKSKSTIDHLVRLETSIRQGFVKNQHTVGIFF